MVRLPAQNPLTPMATALTLDEVVTRLQQLQASNPDYRTRPVHILDMETNGTGLVTSIELDCFDET